VHLISDPSDLHAKGADGLLTLIRGITLGIYVADCAPVWVVAKDGSAGALLHSGKKGTELGIVPEGIRLLCSVAHCSPQELLVVIGPCIRPPCYEVDFAARIRTQAHEEGVMEIHDDMTCTACEPGRYYSYRRERGLTGRMLATLTLLP
jgi:copper oxidase (laccase) domain-containing protein